MTLLKRMSRGSVDIDLLKYTFRLSLFGAGHVGKTEIVRRFMHDEYSESYTATVEDFHTTTYDFRGLSLSLEIVDTSGTEQFPAMRELNIRKSNMVFLVYDVLTNSSFLEVARLYDIVRAISVCPIIIVAAKSDKLPDAYGYQNRGVKHFIQSMNDHALFHVLCSAKQGFNIHRVFDVGLGYLVPHVEEIKEKIRLKRKVQIYPEEDKGEAESSKGERVTSFLKKNIFGKQINDTATSS